MTGHDLNGTAWEVVHTDARHNRLSVKPAASGGIPVFDSRTWEEVDGMLAREMRRLLEDDYVPDDLDPIAARHLIEARKSYAANDLASQTVIPDGEDCHLLTWQGSRFNRLVAMILGGKGFVCSANEVGVSVAGSHSDRLRAALATDVPSIDDLSSQAAVLEGKYDRHVPEELRKRHWVKRHKPLEDDVTAFSEAIAEM